jgi:hypothetical protein
MSQYQTRNKLFHDRASVIFESEFSLLYKAGMDNFNKPLYNIAVLCLADWTPEKVPYWHNSTTGHGAYGPNGLESLIENARKAGEQARLVHTNLGNTEAIARLVKSGQVSAYVAEDIDNAGYYTESGYYLRTPKGGPREEGQV